MNDAPAAEAKSLPRVRGRKRQQGSLATYLLGAVVCIGLPAFVTAIAPVCVTRFERREGQVSATVRRHLLFVIPYSTSRVTGVTKVDDRLRPGSRRRDSKSEDEAFLVIEGDSGVAEAAVSPVNVRGAVERAQAFLADPAQPELRLITVANWKFGVFAGGALSLLTLLYVTGVLLSAGQFLLWLALGDRSAAEPRHDDP